VSAGGGGQIRADSSRAYVVSLSYLEIYNEEIRDLLTNSSEPTNLRLKQDAESGVYVEGLTHHVITDTRQCLEAVAAASQRRIVQQTMMGSASSRSHLVAVFKVERNGAGEKPGQSAKLSLVELAGSHRLSRSGISEQALKEAKMTSVGLIALGDCISALSEASRHIPYRNSKLTRLLQDSLGRDTTTVFSLHVSPSECDYDETIGTLRFGARLMPRDWKNKPEICAPSTEFNFPPPTPHNQLPATAPGSTLRNTSAQSEDEAKKTKEETKLEEEEWVVVIPHKRDESDNVVAVARILEDEGVTSIAPAAFLARFQQFLGAK